ncbi:MAG: thiamine pyrophosphate-dependent dehydrogenase E1 component subunit alpha, partial [Actinobacteria bacterium]|nr:thiamine pyrophosphate-dependent dehydrogenase E1 component subunit alpha [Actinomycetota bacterium]
GQEAIAAGACATLSREDYITTTHRGHGHCLAKGADPEPMMAELFGRETGTCRGRGGSMHLADAGVGILGANGVVGAGIPLAVGAALAARRRSEGRVAMAFFGEGAVHTGAFHESMVLAVAWQAPVIFVCENNQYAEFTRSEGAWGGPGVVERAGAYGVPATSVDGNDVRAVEAAVGAAVASARSGSGPAFLEMRTYRMRGHSEGDAEPYRSEGELDEWTRRDPIDLVGRLLAEAGHADEVATTAAVAEEEMAAAVEQALAAPYPEPETVLEYVLE